MTVRIVVAVTVFLVVAITIVRGVRTADHPAFRISPATEAKR